jgi:hypothetical protein
MLGLIAWRPRGALWKALTAKPKCMGVSQIDDSIDEFSFKIAIFEHTVALRLTVVRSACNANGGPDIFL